MTPADREFLDQFINDIPDGLLGLVCMSLYEHHYPNPKNLAWCKQADFTWVRWSASNEGKHTGTPRLLARTHTHEELVLEAFALGHLAEAMRASRSLKAVDLWRPTYELKV
jgi:hypothetical protein